MMNVTSEAVQAMEDAAKKTVGWDEVTNRKWNSKDKDKRIRSLFGAPCDVIANLWERVEPCVDKAGADRKHLLWALVFLKVYASEEVHCAIVGWPNPKSYREWSWYFVEKIYDLQDDVIVWGNRFDGQPDMDDIKFDCMISTDCTDCHCDEPFPASPDMYAKKFNGPGLKYEVGVCIKTGYIVWISGPFPGGNSEPTIFREGLMLELEEWELVECDTGLKGNPKARLPYQALSKEGRKEKSIVRGRHENVNGRLKHFNVLCASFHHSAGRDREEMFYKHGMCFAAVAVITQLKFENGESLYDVDYDVHYST